MKKILLTLVSILSLASGLSHAQEVSLGLAFESEYVFRGVQLADETIMPSVDLTFGDGYFGVWAALPADNMFGDEIDFYAGYAPALNDTTSMDIGLCLYYYPDFSGGETLEGHVGFSWDVPASPSATLYYDIDLEAITLEGGLGHSFPINDSSSIDWAGSLGYVDMSGFNMFYWGTSLDYVVSLSEAASFSIGARYSGNDITGPVRNGNVWGGMSISASF